MIVPVMSPQGTAPPPSQEEVSAILNKINSAKTSNESIDAAYALCTLLLNTVGFRGLTQYGVIAEIKKSAADKKSGLRRESAQNLLGAIFERFPPSQPLSEAFLLLEDGGLIGIALDALADKGVVVRDAAQYAIDALFASLSPEAMVTALMPALLEYIKKAGGKWQGVIGALVLLQKMADKAKITIGTTKEEAEEQDVLRDMMGAKLAALIPVVENCMLDMKTEVEKQAVITMTSITTLLTNDDVIPRIPLLIETMHHPSTEAVHKAIHALSMTTFVAVVTSPVLALLTPFLERSLNNPGTPQEVLRQTVVITENLTKLVHDPIEARTFLPMLQPGVKSVVQRASLPEVREIATRALDVMDKAMSLDQKTVVERVSAEDVGKVLDKEIMNNGGVADLVTYKLARQYITEMISEDVNHRHIARITSKVATYIKDVIRNPGANDAIAADVHKFYLEEDHRKYGVPEKEDDGEIEIVNAHFSLAYGGMLLLSHTNLRLLKGHRYGLCGRNGAGKSTLMRSIASGKLEGFPSQDVLRTCYVEHNQGEDADISILEFMVKDPTIAKEGKERISAVLEEFGFTAGPEGRQSQPVGSLSGGWKMKLALARAMLQKADVLLLDEPTNHLDVANIAWLENYLKTHPDITSLIVSHDSGFLDNVTTDIYHYEPGKKLALYKGNLAAFVKVRPEAKSYYTLSASNVQFKFPPPGILSGVKSNTRAIIRMSHASYTYPGASKPSLTDASCQLTLSSRIAVIGPNGAGKSTLIKMLTGETIPTEGKVEKHPNLRIGYIKQHALEHVEMHLEKTPNQYLQWRYANGDDREVHMKQTRILSEADKLQMEKWVDCGEGVKRQIEALVGRQKHKKTYKYEVKWRGLLPKHNSFMFRDTLTSLGFDKLVQEFDDHEASREGLGYRELQPSVISKHFEDLGLDPDIANHNEIGSLSGGQKVKVVIAGAMWNNPHLLVLDEPTNFLDRDSLGGLAVAIRDFKGGVVMISHNEEFVGALATETWHVDNGRMTHRSSNNLALDRFEDSAPASAVPSGLNTPALSGSVASSAVNSDAEGPQEELKFRAKKKKKMTKKELKEREARRRLRHIDWLNSPKGTPKPADTDDEAE
ncbi:[NU+] prion formation protein 1 [Podospora fimiseda]|uniref:[NU+] prion formation protein 1 n=1 Tax=Podospora fimiseda TaxID=252190 RepID=A0AAN7H4M3_9PEZI|nr:[NU+] prion formation protein 1 [Podospora fimiseda]